MVMKLFSSLNIVLMEIFPRYAILRCRNKVSSYRACDESQEARTRLMYAYVCFPKRRNDAVHMHNEVCRNHMETRYSTHEKEASIALRIAHFRRDHLDDERGAQTYAAFAFDVARTYSITAIVTSISREFPELLYN